MQSEIIQFKFNFFSKGDKVPLSLIENIPCWESENDIPEGILDKECPKSSLIDQSSWENSRDFTFSEDDIGIEYIVIDEASSSDLFSESVLEYIISDVGLTSFLKHNLSNLFEKAKEKRIEFKNKKSKELFVDYNENIRCLSLWTLWECDLTTYPSTQNSAEEHDTEVRFVGFFDSKTLNKTLKLERKENE